MALKDYIPINFPLVMNPFNWVIIVLMVAIAATGVALVFPNVIASKD